MSKMNKDKICKDASKLISDIILKKRKVSDSLDKIMNIQNDLYQLDDKYYVNTFILRLIDSIIDEEVQKYGEYLSKQTSNEYYKQFVKCSNDIAYEAFNEDSIYNYNDSYFIKNDLFIKNNITYKIKMNGHGNYVIENLSTNEKIEDRCVQDLTVCNIFDKIENIVFEKTGTYYTLSDDDIMMLNEKNENIKNI